MAVSVLFGVDMITKDKKAFYELGKISKGSWKEIFKELGDSHRMGLFHIGDAILECERQYGESAPEFVAYSQLSVSQLLDASRVALAFPPEVRDVSLGFHMYRDAGADMSIARAILSAASRNGWSREQLRAAKKALKEELDAKKPESDL